MGKHVQSRVGGRDIALLVVCAAILALLFLVGGTQSRAPLSSAETRFVELSESGLQIVPASCSSYAHYQGECSNGYAQSSYGGYTQGGYSGQCTPQRICGWGAKTNMVVNSCSGAVIENCLLQGANWRCLGGACVPPFAVAFIPFTAIYPNDEGGTGGSVSFEASGHLQARPALLKQGATTRLYWNTENAESCIVTEDNPDIDDSWGLESSGESGQESSEIRMQTIYTLTCQSVPDASPATVTESVTVNIIPIFEEQ